MVKDSFCAQWPIFVFILMFVLDCCPGGRSKHGHYKISNRGSQVLIFYLWYLIESMMPCIWTRCSGPLAEKQAHNIKDPAVYLTVDMGYFLSLFVLNSSGGLLPKSFFQFHLTIEASAIWSSSRVWQLNLLEFVFGWVRTIFLETLPNNMWWYRGCLIFFFFRFLTPRLN